MRFRMAAFFVVAILGAALALPPILGRALALPPLAGRTVRQQIVYDIKGVFELLKLLARLSEEIPLAEAIQGLRMRNFRTLVDGPSPFFNSEET